MNAARTTLVEKLQALSVRRLVVLACALTLIALALMIWSVLDPTPLPVMVVMSIGQAFGTGGLLCYLIAVLLYQWLRKRPGAPTPSSPTH